MSDAPDEIQKTHEAQQSRDVQQAVDDLYKTDYGKIVSAIFTHFRDVTIATVEDTVQDAFAAALTSWTATTIPANPGGWIYTVSRNRMVSLLRDDRRRWSPLDGQSDHLLSADTAPTAAAYAAAGDVYFTAAFKDQQLRLLFACAHPDLSPKVQIVITLKYVANLKTDAIARALGMSADGIEKLLFRARKKIRDERLFLLDPGGPTAIPQRLPTVHKMIYLIFNEGYKPSSGDEAVNTSLCEEALLLCKDLLDHQLGDSATTALYALMLFNAARFSGRTTPEGDLLDLDGQDRSRWSRPMIALACDLFRQSRGGPMSSYHFEAAIAWVHCSADSFADTNWRLISRLYLRLLRAYPNPFVELNYAIALYYAGTRSEASAGTKTEAPAGTKDKAFEILHGLLQQPFMNEYYLLNAALGKFYLLEGDLPRAKEFFTRTLQQTTHPREIAFIRRLSPP